MKKLFLLLLCVVLLSLFGCDDTPDTPDVPPVTQGYRDPSHKTGTYKITGEDGEREITFIYEEDGEEKEDTYSFSEMEKDGEKYIVIGGFNYEKED